MNYELKMTPKKAIVAYLRVLYQNLRECHEQTHDNSEQSPRPRKLLEYEAGLVTATLHCAVDKVN
jgi:hypothetical protein